jgi:serine/threonine protein kinase
MHSRRIVHRDLRPQNILFTKFNNIPVVKISDFGFSKKLDAPGSSDMSIALESSQTYLAPEVVQSKFYNEASDVYALGCVFYHVITGAFKKLRTDMYGVTNNSLYQNLNFDPIGIDSRTCDNVLVRDLIDQMTRTEPRDRVNTTNILKDPFFWTPLKILNLITDVSNRMERKDGIANVLLSKLEVGSSSVVRDNWMNIIDEAVRDELLIFRRYNGYSVCDLLRAIRNKVNKYLRTLEYLLQVSNSIYFQQRAHYENMNATVKKMYGPLPNEFLNYWTTRFPQLVLHSFQAAQMSGLNIEENFKDYF